MELCWDRTKCETGIMRFFYLFLLLCVIITENCAGFNVDLEHKLLYGVGPDTTFGYSLSLIGRPDGTNMLLVGAPTANSSHDRTFQPGVVFVCGLSPRSCKELPLQIKKEPIIQGRFYYSEMRDGGWLGVSMDVSSDDSQYVVCGHLWKDKQFSDEIYLANGICYVGATDLSINKVRRLLPLVRQGKQLVDRQYIFALGLAGLSVHYSRDKSTLLMGAPGAYRFSGTVAAVSNYSQLLSNTASATPPYRVFVPNENRDDDTYFGYAITSGKFFNDQQVYYVAGAPRQGPNGKAFIFLFPEDWEDAVNIKYTREGVQMGEYFGGSVCAADFNADGFDDLVIGSPFYSTEVEEGRVNVFMSEKTVLSSTPIYLTGSKKSGARFGNTITAVGDLNLDGYTDLAVGAPYEGQGAVYIYHGSISGLKDKFAQRISASDIDSQLRGFGLSISKARDIDNNFYPDFAIGAPASSQAVILRSKPIVQIWGSISFSVNHINTDIKNCSLSGGESVTCFVAQLCSTYSGKHVPTSLDVQTLVSVDQHLSRVEIYENGQLFSKFNFTSTFTSDRSKCRSLLLYVKKDVQDFLSAVVLTASHIPVLAAHERIEFCPTCPVIDKESSSNFTKSLTFFTGCGDDDKCISDLQLKANFVKYGEGDSLILGTDDTLQLVVKVENKAEPAFQTVLKFTIPSDVDFVRVPGECSFISQFNLTCYLGNPLTSGHEIPLNFTFDLKRVTVVETLVFYAEVTTASEELQPSLNDNQLSINLPVKSVTGIALSGWTTAEEQFVFNRTNPGLVPVTHMYQITATEPSPINELNFVFKFPISTVSKESFVQRFSVDVLNNYKLVPSDRCHPSVEMPTSPFIVFNHQETEHGKAAVMDCDSMACHVIKCTVGPFAKRDIVTVNISALVDLSTISLNIMHGENIIILQSSGVATIESTASETAVKTIFVPQDLVPQSAGIPWWIILLAVLGGILLLVTLTFVLYKCGFFQRKRPEHLLEESDGDINEHREEEEDSQ